MSESITFRLGWWLARISFWLNRFRTLPRADRVFLNAKPGTLVERRLFGFSFLCDVSRGGPPRLLYLEGERYVSEAEIVLGLLKPGFRVVDIGANIGYYCLLFFKGIGENGKVVAIEPSPENLRELRLNVERNNLNGKVDIIASAVGDQTDVVGLQSGLNSGITTDAEAPYRVPVDTLDNIVRETVDLVKMDIEGYEALALKGASRLLSQCPILFIEIHPVHIRNLGSTAVAVVAHLREIYDDIEIFEPCQSGTRLSKVFRRYTGIGQINQVRDVEAYVARVSIRQDALPFWAVCRASNHLRYRDCPTF